MHTYYQNVCVNIQNLRNIGPTVIKYGATLVPKTSTIPVPKTAAMMKMKIRLILYVSQLNKFILWSNYFAQWKFGLKKDGLQPKGPKMDQNGSKWL